MSVQVAVQDALPGVEESGLSRWLYVGDDTAWRLRAERGPLSALERIDSAERLQAAAWRLRRPFIDWIGELSAANDSQEWWASELAARNSYTMFFDRVCSLAAALELIEDDMLVVCSTPAIAAEIARATRVEDAPTGRASRDRQALGRRGLRAWARFAPSVVATFPGRMLETARLSLDSDPRYRKRLVQHYRRTEPGARRFEGPETCLLFTFVDKRNFQDGRYRDPYFDALVTMLRARGCRVAFVPRVLSAMPFDEAVAQMTASGEVFFLPDEFLELDDLRDCARRAAQFTFAIPENAAVGGVPVALLATEFAERQRSSQASAMSLVPLVRRLAEAGVRPGRIIHTYEGHSWELALTWSVRRHLPDSKVVAYENVNMTRLALSMYPARSELGLRPLPDRIVTNGPAYRDVLVDEGVPADMVRVGCGLRHAYLWTGATSADRRSGSRLCLLVATDASLGPAAEMVEKAAQAFLDDPSVRVVVKCHPLLRESDIRAFAPGLEYTNEPIGDLLDKADAMLYAYSAVGYEALAKGVPPIFLRAETTLDLDQLEPVQELRWEARTPDELRTTLSEIAGLDDEELDAWRASARTAAARAFAAPTPECVDAFLS